jgi:hypothetical protein
MEADKEQPIKALKIQVTEYVELKAEHTRLGLIESTAKITAYFASTLIIVVLILFFVLAMFVAVSFFIGQMLGSFGLGFLISGVIYLLVLGLFLLAFKKKLELYIINKIIDLTDGDQA